MVQGLRAGAKEQHCRVSGENLAAARFERAVQQLYGCPTRASGDTVAPLTPVKRVIYARNAHSREGCESLNSCNKFPRCLIQVQMTGKHEERREPRYC